MAVVVLLVPASAAARARHRSYGSATASSPASPEDPIARGDARPVATAAGWLRPRIPFGKIGGAQEITLARRTRSKRLKTRKGVRAVASNRSGRKALAASPGSPRKATAARARDAGGRSATTPARVFLLSPAHCGGERARLLLRPDARFELARRVRDGAPLGEVFSFMSGLYFRGKLAYARAFADEARILVITPCEGLRRADEMIDAARIARYATVDIHHADARYRDPLLRDLRMLREVLPPDGQVVLLGSVASDKYVVPMLEVLRDQLVFPPDFVGRGDMSRGGLMLRAAASGTELPYAAVAGALRHGPRPPRLTPRSRSAPLPA